MKRTHVFQLSAIALIACLPFIVYFGSEAAFWSAHARARPAIAALREAVSAMRSDTLSGYQDAAQRAEAALALDASQDTNRTARGLLAYVWTILWGEYFHDPTSRARAEKHLRTGLENEEATAWLFAAEALFLLYDGKLDEGLQTIQARIASAEAEQKRILVFYLVRGQLELRQGDREAAKRSLEFAEALSPGEPRVMAQLKSLAALP